MKRNVLVFILVILVVLVGCSAKDKTEDKATAKADKTEEQQIETKIVKAGNGEVEIPKNPERIVADEYLATLVALDVIPVGAPGLTLENYYVKDALKGIESIGVYGAPSTEKVLELAPDLIITGNPDNEEAYKKIAPTIVIPYGDLKNAEEELTYFGALFDKEEEAKQWLADYADQVKIAKEKVDKVIPTDKTFSIIEYTDKAIYVYGDNFGRGGQPIYQALGRKPPVKIADELMEKQWQELSQEMLADYAGDYLIVTSNNATLEDLKADPIWGSLPAVQQDKVYIWPEERSWYYDPIAVSEQLKELTEWLMSK